MRFLLLSAGSLHVSKPTWWLESRFHFSFADYWDQARMHFGALRVVNDDLVKARAGFGCVLQKPVQDSLPAGASSVAFYFARRDDFM